MTDTMIRTGNAVPSAAPEDRFDNSIALDLAMNSEADDYLDRQNELRRTFKWMERAATGIPAVEAALAAAQSALEAAAARDAAQLTAGVFATTAAGIAATADGAYFSVPVASDATSLILYKNTAGVAVEVTRYPSASAVENLKQIVDNDLAFTKYPSLDPSWPHVIADKSGLPLLGVKSSGVAWGLFDSMPGLPCLGDYVWSIQDIAGVILLGFKWSGEVVAYGLGAGEVVTYVDGPQGAQDAFVLVGGVPYQLTSTGDNFSPVAASGSVRFIRRYGSVSSESVAIPVAGSLADFVGVFLHFLASGQSLGLGSYSIATTLQPPTANRLFTINDGVRLVTDSGVLAPEMVAPFIPLVAKITEPPVVQLTAQLNRQRGLPSNAAALSSFHGRGGVGITNLWKGTQPYANAITAVTAAKAACDSLGVAYRVPLIDWIHGENDRNSAAGLYASRLTQMQSDYETDIKAITAQPEPVPILLDQISNWTSYGGTESFVPFDQLAVALDNPSKFKCAGPKYWAATVDGVHLGATDSMRLGVMHGAPAQAILDGNAWLPTHCVSAVRSGVVVTLKFHTPCGPLVSDVVNVEDPGNWGIRWIDDTISASVIAVRLEGDNTVSVTLSGTPTGSNPMIGIADIGVAGAAGGPTSGPRSCLRDSAGALDSYGYRVNNWACHQRVAVV